MSQRSCERIFGVSQNTVAKLLEEAGDMAIAYLGNMSDLTIEKIQADELYAFIRAKEFNTTRMLIPSEDAGTVWTYLAVCSETKLIFAYHLGDQTVGDATAFMRRVASKLKRQHNGDFAVRPTIATDGLVAYPEAVDRAFGSDVNFGVINKSYSKTDERGNRLPGSRYQGSERKRRIGEIAAKDIHTSHVERQNLNTRMGVRRYGRRTNAFSKKVLNHERHLALWIMYHNLCWVPRPLLVVKKDEKGKEIDRWWVKRLPAAIAAGISDKLWAIEDLLALTDAFVAERAKALRMAAEDAAAPLVMLDEDPPLQPPFWVYRSFRHHTTKVHAATCSNCRDGAGRAGTGGTVSGEWLPFYRCGDAVAAAEELSPDRNSICNMCLGQYRKLGRGR